MTIHRIIRSVVLVPLVAFTSFMYACISWLLVTNLAPLVNTVFCARTLLCVDDLRFSSAKYCGNKLLLPKGMYLVSTFDISCGSSTFCGTAKSKTPNSKVLLFCWVCFLTWLFLACFFLLYFYPRCD